MINSNKKYNCVIIDDDFSSVGILSQYISMVPKLQLTKGFLNPLTAVNFVKDMGPIDILLLDINMPLSGLDVAVLLRDHVKYIVFVTGHPEHALAAFEAKSDAFLVKPVSFAKFIAVINRAIASRALV